MTTAASLCILRPQEQELCPWEGPGQTEHVSVALLPHCAGPEAHVEAWWDFLGGEE